MMDTDSSDAPAQRSVSAPLVKRWSGGAEDVSVAKLAWSKDVMVELRMFLWRSLVKRCYGGAEDVSVAKLGQKMLWWR